jgi:hypothetical protein
VKETEVFKDIGTCEIIILINFLKNRMGEYRAGSYDSMQG